MNRIRSAYLWFVGTIYFIVFLKIALICSYIFPMHIYDPWLKRWLRGLFKILSIPVEVVGAENVNLKKAYLYMANHASMLDIPLLGAYVPGFVRGVEASRQHNWPLYGWVMGRLGNIPIERENYHRSIASIRKSLEIIRGGTSIVILPEGYRTLNGHMGKLKKLPFFLAKHTDRPLVPVAICGMYQVKQKGSWKISPRAVKLKFGRPLAVDTIKSLSVTELRDVVEQEIKSLLKEPGNI